jgi:glycosyltransferase involved in cell wall biosynthesis
VVYTVHLPPYYYTAGVRRWLYRFMERLLNRWFTDRVIYVSHRVRQEAIGLRVVAQSCSTVIENGIDLRPYNEVVDRKAVRKSLGTPEDATVFCFVGRFTEQKGIDVLLCAVAALRDRHGAFRVWLVGDGPLRAQLEEHVLKEGLASQVQFLGFRDDVSALLGAIDVFVLPSRYEALPVSVLEAMASGLPCVVTDVGDNAKLVEDGIAGMVVPPENSDALAMAMERLLGDPEARACMGKAARRKAQQYSVERMAARIMDVYEDILTTRSATARTVKSRG